MTAPASPKAPVDPRHLFIMLWSATRFYGDFEPLACDALGRTKLKASDYDAAADTITRTLLGGILLSGQTPETPSA